MREARVPRVLHAIATLNRGGVETWLLQMVRSLDRSICQIDLLLESDQPHAYTEGVSGGRMQELTLCWRPESRALCQKLLVGLS